MGVPSQLLYAHLTVLLPEVVQLFIIDGQLAAIQIVHRSTDMALVV